jgi:hypothetical protein
MTPGTQVWAMTRAALYPGSPVVVPAPHFGPWGEDTFTEQLPGDMFM